MTSPLGPIAAGADVGTGIGSSGTFACSWSASPCTGLVVGCRDSKSFLANILLALGKPPAKRASFL